MEMTGAEVSGATPHTRMLSEMKMNMVTMEGKSKMSSDMMMMEMAPQWFTTKTEVHFLLENLKINSITGIIIAMLSAVLLTLVFEALNFTFNIKRTAFNKREDKHVCKNITSHILLSVLKMISVFVGYIIMVSVMTFNAWLLVSVVVGSGVAHLVLRPFLTLCVTSGQTDMIVSFDEEVRQDLLHDFPTEEEDCNTMNEKVAGDVTQEIQPKETVHLFTESS